MARSVTDMEKSALAIEEGQLDVVPLKSDRKAESSPLNNRTKVLLRQQQRIKGLCLTIFGLLLVTLIFLVLSYEYEPSELIKGRPMARLLGSGSSELLHWHSS